MGLVPDKTVDGTFDGSDVVGAFYIRDCMHFFQSSSRGRELADSGHEVKHGVCRHKKQLIDLGQDTVVMKQARSDRAAFTIEVHETNNVEDEPVIREWSHSYVAMGLMFQHKLQTALLARTYNLEVAACFVRSISNALGCGVRMSALGATTGEEGEELRKNILAAMDVEKIEVIPELPGLPLAGFPAGDVRVLRAARAQTLEDCIPFLLELLGASYDRMIREAVLATSNP